MTEDSTRAWKDQYMLRFPDGMRDRLKELAAENKRSLNAEIIARLETTLTESAPATHFPIVAPGVDLEITTEEFARLLDRHAKGLRLALGKWKKPKDAE